MSTDDHFHKEKTHDGGRKSRSIGLEAPDFKTICGMIQTHEELNYDLVHIALAAGTDENYVDRWYAIVTRKRRPT